WVQFDPTASGLPPGFAGYQSQSAVDFLIEKLTPQIEAFFRQPWMAASTTAFSKTVGPVIERSINWLWQVWRPFLQLSGILISAWLCFQFVRNRRYRGEDAVPA